MKKILLVDDNEPFRRSLSISLEDLGYVVFEASNGMQALELMRKKLNTGDKIESAIVDARMPGLDGFLLYDQISFMDQSIKVVILSAHSYPEQFGKYIMLTKPVVLEELREAIESDIFVHQG